MFSKEKKKIINKRITGSLALRVFFISALLLVLPLILHTVIMYRQEYRMRLEDLFISLEILGENRILLIKEMIDEQHKFLNVVAYQIEKEDLSYAGMSKYFENIAKEYELSKIFFLGKNNSNEWVCRASSKECILGEDYSFLSSLITKGEFAYVGYSPFLKKKLFYVGKTIYGSASNKPIGAVLIASPVQKLLGDLAKLQDSPYPIDLSLITSNNTVFASSDNYLVDKKLGYEKGKAFLSPIESIPNAYELYHHGVDFAIKLEIPKTNLFLLVDVSKEKIHNLQKRDYFIRITTLFFLIIVVGGGLALILTYRISKPFKKLFSIMARVEKGDMGARFEKDAMGFEINVLGEHFNHMITSIIRHQKESEKERLQKEIYRNELKIGHEVQKSLFSHMDISHVPIDVAFGYLPAKEVSGDFYDVFLQKKDKILITIADTADKGVSACLYSFILRSVLRSFALSHDSLEEIIVRTNNLFYLDSKESSMFVTTWVGVYDCKKMTLTYHNAGHTPTYLKRKEVVPLTTDGMALGVVPFEKVETKSITLKPNDLLFLYTDGLIERMNVDSQLYGRKRLENFLEKASLGSSNELIKKLIEEVKEFSGEKPQEDDMTIVVLKFLA